MQDRSPSAEPEFLAPDGRPWFDVHVLHPETGNAFRKGGELELRPLPFDPSLGPRIAIGAEVFEGLRVIMRGDSEEIASRGWYQYGVVAIVVANHELARLAQHLAKHDPSSNNQRLLSRRHAVSTKPSLTAYALDNERVTFQLTFANPELLRTLVSVSELRADGTLTLDWSANQMLRPNLGIRSSMRTPQSQIAQTHEYASVDGRPVFGLKPSERQGEPAQLLFKPSGVDIDDLTPTAGPPDLESVPSAGSHLARRWRRLVAFVTLAGLAAGGAVIATSVNNSNPSPPRPPAPTSGRLPHGPRPQHKGGTPRRHPLSPNQQLLTAIQLFVGRTETARRQSTTRLGQEISPEVENRRAVASGILAAAFDGSYSNALSLWETYCSELAGRAVNPQTERLGRVLTVAAFAQAREAGDEAEATRISDTYAWINSVDPRSPANILVGDPAEAAKFVLSLDH